MDVSFAWEQRKKKRQQAEREKAECNKQQGVESAILLQKIKQIKKKVKERKYISSGSEQIKQKESNQFSFNKTTIKEA